MPTEPGRTQDLAVRDRDLGFGPVVADSSHQRLLNRDGSFNVRRTGLARPRAEIVFSHNAVVAPYREGTALMFRTANLRRSQIIELSAKVIFSRFETDAAGEMHRHFYDLALERRKVTFFPLSWTIVHPIDEESPLHGDDMESCQRDEAEFVVLMTGIDESFSQAVHARTSYVAREVVWNARFKRILELGPDAQGVSIDVGRIHELEQVDQPAL